MRTDSCTKLFFRLVIGLTIFTFSYSLLPSQNPVKTDVFFSGTEGYTRFRIPALVETQSGVILAFCEARKGTGSDFDDMDLALRRSLDKGLTWQPMQILWDRGTNSVGPFSPVVDRESGDVILLVGIKQEDSIHVMRSSDDGVTWTAPVDITSSVARPPNTTKRYVPGPGHGIQLPDGRLVFPARGDGSSYIIYSDDHGATWGHGQRVWENDGMNECMAVGTINGGIYMAMRNRLGLNRRAYAWSDDFGETWSEVRWDPMLKSPVCQASIIQYSDEETEDKNRILFANPAIEQKNPPTYTYRDREDLTVRISYDGCKTWHPGKLLQGGKVAYSDLVILNDSTIGCFYENGVDDQYEKMTFARFGLDWLVDENAIRVPADQSTIAAAVAAAGVGDEIRVRSDYTEAGTVNIVGKTVFITSYNSTYTQKESGAKVIVSGGEGFVIDNSNVTIEGFTQIRSVASKGILLTNNSSALTLKGCTISECGDDGIDQDVASTLYLEDCSVSENSSEGFYMYPSNRALPQNLFLKNCTISSNTHEGIEFNSASKSSIVVEGCKISDNEAEGLELRSHGGTVLSDGYQTWDIVDSTFSGNYRNVQIYTHDALNRAEVFANVDRCEFYNTPGGACAAVSGHNNLPDSSVNVTLTNCLFVAGTNNGCVGSLNGGIADVILQHCTFVAKSDGQFCVYSKLDGGSYTVKNSILSGSVGLKMDSGYSGSIGADFNLINASLVSEGNVSSGGNTFYGDPLFKEASSGNFSLIPGSPAIDSGTVLGVLEDLLNMPRDANPDMGCYEFQWGTTGTRNWNWYK